MTEQNSNSSFSFLTPELTHRVELILHLLEYSNHLVIVKGEHESGKSTLCEELSRKDEPNLLIRKLSVNTHTKSNDLLLSIIGDENKDDPHANIIDQSTLNQWLERCQNKQHIPVLLIDNVDLFSDELINVLFEILSNSNATYALHFCLFCDPSFLERLDESGINQDESRSLHIIEMPALSEKQTEQYIHSKFSDSDAADINLFDEKTIKQIHRISHGMPGRINALCEQYLEDPAKKATTDTVKPSVNVKATFLKYRLPLMIAASLFILSIGITSLLHRSTDQKIEKQTIKLNLPNKGTNGAEQTNEDFTESVSISEPSTELEPVTIEELSLPVIPELNNDLMNKAEVTVYNEEGQVVAKESDLESLTVTEAIETINPKVAVADELAKMEETMSEPNPIKLVEVMPEPVVETKPAMPQNKDVSWLVKQDPKKYVLQLIGAYEKETIDIYLKTFKDDDSNVISFKASNKGKEWHVLVYGLYDNRDAAVAAIESLPTKAKLMAPWPRTVESVKALLK